MTSSSRKRFILPLIMNRLDGCGSINLTRCTTMLRCSRPTSMGEGAHMWTDLDRIVVVLLVGLLAFAPASPRVTEAQERPGGKQETSHTAPLDHQHHQQTPA